ncbi:fucose permease [Trichoderma reesei RUT C-30]|uniref:Fucose permease n=1 Tax=Hypocrea jecorina (strain ATCC 56765 / BCRC 32924 / NRRL 11460 / Rut C-30) TaxID=1344414 RepID=A0A024S3F9_HYPJR|nr:fucose permease [Trichoderma reesei RUT C-30]
MESDSDVEPGGPVANRGPAVLAVTIATLVLASVFVFARMISRYFIVKRFTWDDRTILLAWLISFFLSFTICLGVANGLGKHDEDIPASHIATLRHCEYVFSILYNPALMATKTSILIFYLRLARNTQMLLRFASWLILVIVNIAGIVLTFMNIFQCTPVQAAWNANYTGPTRCIPLLTEFICAAPVNIVTDLAILALPIPVLTGMRLPSRQKTILVLTFTLGVFVAVVDVVRVYYLQQAITDVPTGITSDPSSRFGGQADFAYNASLALMWSAVEVNVGTTCACIPTLKPLVLRLLPAMLYKSKDNNGSRPSPSDTSDKSQNQRGSDNPSVGNNLNNSGVVKPEPVAHGALGNDRQLASPGPDAPMSAMEFLTTPDMTSLPLTYSANRSRTTNTLSTDHSYENGVYFGFVNMTKPKSMLRASSRESWKYCTIVAILFFLWGISYGLLNTLNNAIAAVDNMSTAQTIGLTSAYFGGGYFFGPLLVGEWILRRDEHSRSKRHRQNDENIGGYKATFITGLCIYGTGTIIFWPSAVTNSFGGFMLSNFVVGFGLSVLEVAANSFMVLCGPSEYGETRLMLAQAVQGVGSVLSGLLAQKVFFTSLSHANAGDQSSSTTLINVQWTYLGITLLCVVLALFFYYMPLPEVSDSELEKSTEQLPVDPTKRSIGGLQLRTVSLILAVMAQYLYVAGQESNSTFFNSLLLSVLPSQPKSGMGAARGAAVTGLSGLGAADPDQPPGLALSLSDYLTVGHTAFAVSRFAAAYLTYLAAKNPRLPQPRTVLSFCSFLCFLSALLCVVIRPSNANLLFIPACLFFFAEGPIWPLIFAIGMRGQGRRTKRAAAFITMGASGPAFFPFVMYGIIIHGGTVQQAYILIVALQVVMMALPLFLTHVKDARLMVDPHLTRRGRRNEGERPMNEVALGGVLADGEPRADPTTITTDFYRGDAVAEKPHRGFLGAVSKGLSAKLNGSRRKSSPALEVEHSEGSLAA